MDQQGPPHEPAVVVATRPPDAARKRFGGELRRLREATGLTQQALADRIGVSAAMLSHLEAGRRRASEDILAKLGDALGLDAEQLVDLNRTAQMAHLPEDLKHWIEVRLPPAGFDVNDWGELDHHMQESVIEGRLEGLLETQLRSARDGHFESGDRITMLAAVVDGLRELDSDDLLRVSGFLAGLQASKPELPGVNPGSTDSLRLSKGEKVLLKWMNRDAEPEPPTS